ncbi:MAG: hypothetical protein K0S80_2234 [Neobacillus sp.]|nr:hypothetical protein [Neobacillus sp.]
MGRTQDSIDILSSQIVAEQVERIGNSTIECFAGMDLLKKVAGQYVNCSPELTQGRLFEIIEATKFNMNAAKAGEMFRAFTTDSLGDPHAAADIVIKDRFNILKEIQAKSSDKASRLARMVSDSKYGDMDRLVNSEKADRVKELVEKRADTNSIYADEYKQAAPHVKGELKYKDISSGGTTHDEALKAAKNTNEYVFKQQATQFVSGTFSAMANGALAGAFVGGGTAIFQQGFQVVTGKEDVKAASKKVVKQTLESSARNAVVAGVAHGIKYMGRNLPFIKGNAAVALASSAVKCTELTYQLIKGKITFEKYLEGVGSNAVSTFAGIVLSAAGGLMFGPIGAAAAATVAMIGMNQLYQTFIRAREDLKLAVEERKRAEMLSALMIEQIKLEEKSVIEFYQQSSKIVTDLTVLVKQAIYSDSSKIAETIYALTNKLGVFIKYDTQEKFDDFMLSEEPLRL